MSTGGLPLPLPLSAAVAPPVRLAMGEAEDASGRVDEMDRTPSRLALVSEGALDESIGTEELELEVVKGAADLVCGSWDKNDAEDLGGADACLSALTPMALACLASVRRSVTGSVRPAVGGAPTEVE